MTTYLVREATPSDLRAVRGLTRRVRRDGTTAPATGRRSNGGERSWVVEAARKEIVGCCTVRDLGTGEWELTALALQPSWRGFGLGRALVEHVVRHVRSEGGLALVYRGDGVNATVEPLVNRLGFEGVSEGSSRYFRRHIADAS